MIPSIVERENDHFSAGNVHLRTGTQVSPNPPAISWAPWSSRWVWLGSPFAGECPNSFRRGTTGMDRKWPVALAPFFKWDFPPWVLHPWHQWCATNIPMAYVVFWSILAFFVALRIMIWCWSWAGSSWRSSCWASWPFVCMQSRWMLGCWKFLATVSLNQNTVKIASAVLPDLLEDLLDFRFRRIWWKNGIWRLSLGRCQNGALKGRTISWRPFASWSSALDWTAGGLECHCWFEVPWSTCQWSWPRTFHRFRSFALPWSWPQWWCLRREWTMGHA